MNDEKLHYRIYDMLRSIFLQTSRLPYTIYSALLGLLYIVTSKMEETSESYRAFSSWASLLAILLAVAFIFIVVTIANSNKGNIAAIFKKLSALPLLLIVSYIPFVIGIFKNAGGWWILYALILFGLPLAFILYGIVCTVGFILRKKQ